MRYNVAFALAHLSANWKTSAQQILNVAVGLGAIAPQVSWLTPHQALKLVSTGLVAKVLLGVFQKDGGAGVVIEHSGAAPVAGPTHEVSDNPQAKVVG